MRTIAPALAAVSAALLLSAGAAQAADPGSAVEKCSRKLGVMDVLTYRLRLHETGGQVAVETDNVWVLPRKELA